MTIDGRIWRSWMLGVACWLACACADQGASSTEFESDEFLPPEVVLAAGGPRGNTGSAPAASGGSAAGTAVIPELVALDGERLFVLSALSGLAVVDVSDPAHLRVLGRYRSLPGQPVQLYLRGDRLWVLCSAERAIEPGMSHEGTSYLVGLDVSDPASLHVAASLSVPGVIDASQLLGDVLYIASNETPGCSDCTAPAPPSVITSIDVRDAAHARQIEQLRFGASPEEWVWMNSMVVTPQRLYLAGPQRAAGSAGSTIQIIDISQGDGSMRAAARQQVSGAVSQPVQLDEQQGVLRVISQQRGAATLQTFALRSSDELEPLGELSLPLPPAQAAALQGVRFDGARAYAAVGGVLHRLDLADPAAPAIAGSAMTDASLDYLELHGDRLFALGTKLNASERRLLLFDVSEREPRLLSQVGYPKWPILDVGSSLPTAASLTLVPDQGLILLPAGGYDFGGDGTCDGRSSGSLVLVAHENDQLTLLSTARSQAQPRRAIMHGEHALLAGEERVEAFNIADRKSPSSSSGVTLTQNVAFVAHLDRDIVARVVQPLDNIDPVLELSTEAQVDDPDQRLSALSLRDQLTTDPAQTCQLQLRVQAVHAIGSRLHVVFEAYFSAENKPGERRSGVLVIDASDPRAPRLAGKSDWDTLEFYPYTQYAQSGYVARPTYVWHGESLVLIEVRVGDEPQDKQLRVVDMRDPAAPISQTVALSQDVYVGLLVEGDSVYASHYRTLNSTRIKHYLDRVELSDPAEARLLPEINTPGALLQIDPETRRGLSYSWRFASARPGAPGCISGPEIAANGGCRVLRQSLQLFQIEADVARSLDQLALPAGELVSGSARASDRVFAVLSAVDGSMPLLGLSLGKSALRAERVELSAADFALAGSARVDARADLVLISSGDAAIIANRPKDGSLRVQQRQKLADAVSDVSLSEAGALLALGLGGSAWLEL